jgi:ribosome biogenesis GTPase
VLVGPLVHAGDGTGAGPARPRPERGRGRRAPGPSVEVLTDGTPPGDHLLAAYGWSDRWLALFAAAEGEHPGARPARVVQHDGIALLSVFRDEVRQVPTPRNVDPLPVVGDWIVVGGEGAVDDDEVVAVLPRTSLLRRKDPMADEEQPLVANSDLILVVCGLDRPVKDGRITRSIALAWDADAVPLVVLTKADGVDDAEDVAATVAEVEENAPGVDVVAVSAVTGEGMEQLRAHLRDRTSCLLGESGAGKSTLVNALVGEGSAAVGAVRKGDSKGKHTTTARTLHLLPGGGVLVDTPGIRSVGLWTDTDSVQATFDDVDELSEDCRFRDCGHDTEPGCAVVAAVADGRLDAERLDAWRTLQREAVSTARRADEHQKRLYEKQFGRITKAEQKRKGRS